MRNLLFGVITLMTSTLMAQSWCGTNPSPEFLEFYANKDMSHLASAGSRDVNAIIYVPIQYHIVGTDAGSGYYTIRELLAVHCLLNQRYASSQIQFYLYDDPHYIRSTRYYTMSDGSVDRDMKNGNNIADVCNVYIVQDAVSSGTTVCGYATFPGFGRQGIVVAKSCSGLTSTTLVHEMGHFLGLPHTFNGWEGRDPYVDPATSTDERVNGSNCATRADRFCDTPADFISDRFGCPYTGPKTDFGGDLYNTVLNESLFMSYSSDVCQSSFSLEQQAEMNDVRRTSRSAMDRYTVPSVVNPASTSLVLPSNLATGVAPFSSLMWNKVSDATHYHLIMSTSSSFNFNNIVDTIVSDTSFKLYNAAISTLYYWKVLPMTLGATCGTYTPTRSFTTSTLNGSVVLTSITCPGGLDGAINLTVTGGTAPYSYSWSTGESFNSITDLTAGTYEVTVTDALARTMVADITVPDGPAININIFPSGATEITADASGGNGGPYTYEWSNGITAPQNSPAAGNVTVTVTDRRGCASSRTLSFSGINKYDNTDRSVKVYPNPLSNTDAVLNIDAAQPCTANIRIFSMNGEELINMSEDIYEGENTFLLATAKFAKGIYIINVSYLDTTKNVRLVIQ